MFDRMHLGGLSLRAAALAGVIVGASGGAWAQAPSVPVRKIAASGEGDLLGGASRLINVPVINGSGHVAFVANSAPAAGDPAEYVARGLYTSAPGGTVHRLLRTFLHNFFVPPLPSRDPTLDSLKRSSVDVFDDNGVISFSHPASTITGATLTRFAASGGVTPVTIPFVTPYPGMSCAGCTVNWGAPLGHSGSISFSHPRPFCGECPGATPGVDVLRYSESTGALSVVSGGADQDHWLRGVNASGTMVIDGQQNDPVFGGVVWRRLLRVGGSGTETLLEVGAPAAASLGFHPSAVYAGVPSGPRINARGDVAALIAVHQPGKSGTVTKHAVVYWGAGTTTPTLVASESVTAVSSGEFGYLCSGMFEIGDLVGLTLGDGGHVVITAAAQFPSGGSSPCNGSLRTGIWRWNPTTSAMRTIALEGTPAPGFGGGVSFVTLYPYGFYGELDVNPGQLTACSVHGQVAFIAYHSGGHSLFATTAQDQLIRVTSVNDSFAGVSGPGDQKVLRVRIRYGEGGNGSGRSINDSGVIAFLAQLHTPDGLGVFVANTNQLPRCAGDANGDWEVDFDDITSVLSLWLTDYTSSVFGTGPGDANGDGVVTFDDITSVLSNWLNACP